MLRVNVKKDQIKGMGKTMEPFLMNMFMIHIPANGFMLFHRSTGGGNAPRNTTMHQQRQ